ncbi:MAG: single-stranded DNA-binding protein [Verrucomicrobia bacterium]|nr:single-stranded DNA-binding protein [Verrucomicrobiota bacterium]
MASFNKVILLGNLTRDPERSYTPKGTAMTKFGLAVNYVYTTEAGEKKEEANFFDIVVWGRQAETAAQYLSKGRPVLIEGRLRYESWQNDKGEKRSKIGIVAEKIQFLGGGQRAQSTEFTEEAGENSGAAAAPRASRPAQRPPAEAAPEAEAEAPAKEKDDIPF